MRQLILAGLVAAAFVSPAMAANKAAPKQAKPVTLELKVKDMVPMFLDFYEAASKPAPAPVAPPAAPATADGKPAPAVPAAPVESDTDRRWRLFKRDYNFTAQADDTAARAALEAAWPKYAGAMAKIEKGFDGIANEPAPIIDSLSLQLGLDKPFSVRLISYVGTFDGKVWTTTEGDVTNIYLPVEVEPAVRDLPMARSLAKLIMPRTAVWGAQPRNLAEQIVAEGVLAHALENAVPGLPVEAYLDLTPAQLAAAKSGQKAEFSAIIAKLRDGSAGTLSSYSGPQLAQARYAGWVLVEAIAKKNHARLFDLVHQKTSDLTGVSEKTLASLNAHK